jgi:hypothetical protein
VTYFTHINLSGLLDAHHHRRAARLGNLDDPADVDPAPGDPAPGDPAPGAGYAGGQCGRTQRGRRRGEERFPLQPNGRYKCETCSRDYASLVTARR